MAVICHVETNVGALSGCVIESALYGIQCVETPWILISSLLHHIFKSMIEKNIDSNIMGMY